MILGLLVLLVLLAYLYGSYKINHTLKKKAAQSFCCFDSLTANAEIEPTNPVVFCSDPQRARQMFLACFTNNSFPKYKIILLFRRLSAVIKLFKEERILQTPAAAAALAACTTVLSDIARLRHYPVDLTEKIYCDYMIAGFQAVRLFFVDSPDEAFSLQRFGSCLQVNNAFNGSSYKYKTRDERYFSFHVYYESQKTKVVKALKIDKPADEFTMNSGGQDRAMLRGLVGGLEAAELEELAFSSGACGCILRNRSEWESTPVGQALSAMPLIKLQQIGPGGSPKQYPELISGQGPLAGIKVLDLTHIIAGPACTRLLAEYGADVLLVRRGGFDRQEQSFLELDGWAGKHAIDLDMNKPAELEKVKSLITQADVVVYSYQDGAFDRFGLSEAGILELNPHVVYASMRCFSDTIWRERPGWAPLAEDITGLSIRNGSQEKPKNLNGVPLDYIPGFILALGTLQAIKQSMITGGAYSASVSLCRVAMWLHECTDLCLEQTIDPSSDSPSPAPELAEWRAVMQQVTETPIGPIVFPSPAVVGPIKTDITSNMKLSHGNQGWRQ